MSKLETPMTLWFWQQVGGTLIEEFCVVSKSATNGNRFLDAVIIKDGPTFRASQSDIELEDKDIIIVQCKSKRLGMYVMGQALFSARLMEKFKPRSIESIALVLQDDSVLRELFESYNGMKVIVYPTIDLD